MKAHLRLIGDVHGYWGSYHLLLRKAHFTVQLGDFGFDYATLSTVDPDRHKFLGGNHDNYDEVEKWPHYLGDYGLHCVPGFRDIFFVRGGYSIDSQTGGRDGGPRIMGLDWWPDDPAYRPAEELYMADCYAALEEYSRIRPDFVITHECPTSVIPHVTASSRLKPTRTNQLLERMLDVHQPRRWVFGHYHRSWQRVIGRTHFTCLRELECLDLALLPQ